MVKKTYKKSLFLFRRDLRLPDNIGLIEALHNSLTVIPAFNFDPEQVGPDNAYKSSNAIQYMIESLKDLESQLEAKKGTLYLFYDDPIATIKHLIASENIDAVFLNYDYTPFALKRDAAIKKLCAAQKIAFHGFHDALLIGDPDLIVTGSKTPYGVYSAFYKKASQKKVPTPITTITGTFYTQHITGSKKESLYKKIIPHENKSIKVNGGRHNALTMMRRLKKFHHYATERNFPAINATTHLSAAHKFGTISIRESYHAIKDELGVGSQLLKELYWRDFFTYVAYHNPFVFGHAYRKKYNNIPWSYSKKNFEAWCNGATGFPIVDAGMRQLNTTGWMHNRVRMIVASFLTKDLHIDWKWGEKYFAQQLVDYDPAVNNGNWQWTASTGCDAQPYFRIFNPWTQQKTYDPECVYIKQWIPALKNIPIKTIHSWFKETHDEIKGYPRPIIDHAQESKKTLAMFKSL